MHNPKVALAASAFDGSHQLNILLKQEIMGNLLYFIAVVLVVLWAVGYVGYNAGGIIHILLVIAVIAILFRLISGRRL